MIIALILITLAYLYLILRFVFGFDAVKEFQFETTEPNTKFSIIIPFRNEAANLHNLLKSLSAIAYPKDLYEILLVDDESTDDSIKVIHNFIVKESSEVNHIRIIKNTRQTASPKKDAIITALSQVKNNWIVTTDADCTFHENWLTTLNVLISAQQLKMIVGPVAYKAKPGFFNSFQVLDFLSLMGATIGGFGIKKPFLCNGANLAYTKDVFEAVNGFKGNMDIASGDDIFLMEKVVKKYPEAVTYLKHPDAIVNTEPETTVPGLLAQRKRWAAKTSAYTNAFGKLVGAIVLLMNFSILAALFLSLFNVFTLKTVGYVFLIKFAIDLWLIQKASLFFNLKNHLKYYLFASVLYPFFNVYVALASWFGGYAWKGRNFTK